MCLASGVWNVNVLIVDIAMKLIGKTHRNLGPMKITMSKNTVIYLFGSLGLLYAVLL